ncbi:hypothetical protein ABH931_006982 [Streptacidiphilus sp. MAP12-33]|uniref:helix-turn-helix domain-containing protein n=1 Tax=Streptacidiphilus sp. MAP12-33 TaxID=3156266 RepID=UPI0035158297
MSTSAQDEPRVIPLRPSTAAPPPGGGTPPTAASQRPGVREPLWRDLVGEALRRERLAQQRTLKDVAKAARISMPYLSELERGRKEASSEVLAAAARALGLGLGDLLDRTRGELDRALALRAGRRHTVGARTAPMPRHDGLCLAA